MTKERLMQYRDLLKEVKQLKIKADKLRAKCERGAIILTDMPRGGVSPDYMVELADVVMLLERRLSRLHCEMVAIEEFISNIPDSKTRQIFSFRYIEGLPWWEIGDAVDYSERQVRRKHYKYLKKSL